MLSDVAIRTLKPEAKPYRMADERGMYLEVRPNGAKHWRLKYRLNGRERRVALGSYPEVSLHRARSRRDEARELILKGTDPCEHLRTRKRAAMLEETNRFETVATEWLEKRGALWVAAHGDKVRSRLARDILPWLGSRAVNSIEAPEILEVLRRVESRGAHETAHRELQYISRIFRYAIATGRAKRDPAADLRGEALVPVDRSKHHATIVDPVQIGALLRAMKEYCGSFVVKTALRLAPLVFVRPGELRQMEWAEIRWEDRTWHIPAERMKMRAVHIVPLSAQAIALLRELLPLTGDGRYAFPGARTNSRPMSNNAVTAALRAIGYDKGQMTGHGFRAMASTLLNEQGWNRDVIERQLAHGERDKVRASYNYAEHLPERRKMMQSWADYLTSLEDGATLVAFFRAA
ncbi:MAG: integrase arm-type DNA-binding domain-containing protein [Steroidobacteraceae bacterium]